MLSLWERIRQKLGLRTGSLRVNVLWTFSGNLFYAACQWGMLSLLAKATDPAMVGQFILGLTITAPVFLLTNLHLRGVQSTDTKAEYAFAQYWGLRWLSLPIALGFVVGAILVMGYRFESALIILLVALAKAIEALSDLLYGLMQKHEKMDRIALSMILKGLLSLGGMAGGIALWGGVRGGCLGLLLAWLLSFLVYDIPRTRELLRDTHDPASLRPTFQKDALLLLFWRALPAGLAATLISLTSSIPRSSLERFYDERALGIFGALAYVIVLGGMVIASVGQAASPRLAALYIDKKFQDFDRLLAKLLLLGLALGLLSVALAWAFGAWFLTIFYKPEYAAHLSLFLWLVAAGGIGYIASFLGYACAATRAYTRLTTPYALQTLVCLVASLLLIPPYGLLGAAWVVGISHLANGLVCLWILFRLRAAA